MRFVVMAWDGDDPDAKERRAAVRPVHLENIQPFVDDGHVLVGGAMLDDQGDMIGSTLVVEFDSRSDLDAWITAEPSGSTTTTWCSGRAAATPALSPPPPPATITTLASGASSSTSSPTVPWPAITSGSL